LRIFAGIKIRLCPGILTSGSAPFLTNVRTVASQQRKMTAASLTVQ
jgi:hypothetical protein